MSITLDAIEQLMVRLLDESLEPKLEKLQSEIAIGFESVEGRLERIEHELLAGNERFRRVEDRVDRVIDHLVENHGVSRSDLAPE